MPNQLIDTVAEVLELSGAAVEKNGESLEALVPEGVAKILHTPELRLYFDPHHTRPDGELVTFQSDFVDRLFALLQGTGNYAHLTLRDLYLKQSTKSAANNAFKY
jgi:hypothetical protein